MCVRVCLFIFSAISFYFSCKVDEVWHYHAGSPITSGTTEGGVHAIAPHPSRNAVFATAGEDKILQVCVVSFSFSSLAV